MKLTANGSIDTLAKVAEANCLNQVSSFAMPTVYADGRNSCSAFRMQWSKNIAECILCCRREFIDSQE
ncbi:MAG: hypothetical protein KDB01_26515 [Planctomycetaceae bacterium]|nr:hypothetical protein [Planctomycetaceae bacterium]